MVSYKSCLQIEMSRKNLHHEIENKLRLDGSSLGASLSNSRFARREKIAENSKLDKKKDKKTSRSRSGSKSPGRGGNDRFLPSLNKQPLSTADFLNAKQTEDAHAHAVINEMAKRKTLTHYLSEILFFKLQRVHFY